MENCRKNDRKNKFRLTAVLSAAALFTIGASMMCWAKGWTTEDGEWVYLDSDGERVTEEWKKSGEHYYYLDEDGFMATSRLIEDDDNFYYVNEYGSRVTNQWVSVENEDGDEVNGTEVDTLWYYFDSNGKAYKASDSEYKTKTIDGQTYIFDQDGHMVSGWVEIGDDTYYLGTENEGWAKTGWQYLEPDEDLTGDEYDDFEWFYFKSTGKMRYSCTAYIDGKYYRFNEDGVMEDEWYSVSTSTESAGISAYASANGTVTNGWVYTTEPGDDSSDLDWYYLVNGTDEDGNTVKGVPFNYESGAGLQAKVIKSKTYIFDEDGKMQDGIVELEEDLEAVVSGAKALDAGIYYFDDSDGSTNGQMQTGKVTVEDDGEYYYYYFMSTGKACTNTVKNGILYGENGQRIQAEDGNSNMIYVTKDDIAVDGSTRVIPAGTSIIISSSGKVRTSGSVKIDGETWKVVDTSTYEAELQADD